jgi:hypothetical protein
VFPMRYELGFYIPEDGVLHSHRRETSNLAKREGRPERKFLPCAPIWRAVYRSLESFRSSRVSHK